MGERESITNGNGNGELGEYGKWKIPKPLDPWSKAGIKSQLEKVHGVGWLSPRFEPYRPIGMPEIERSRFILPTKLMLFKELQELSGPTKPVENAEDMKHVVLPLKLKGVYWNGERWCGRNFSPNISHNTNGFNLLLKQISKSDRRLRKCRVRHHFLKAQTPPPAEEVEQVERESMVVPPLRLDEVMQYDSSQEAAKNLEYMHEYRMEARRVNSERSMMRETGQKMKEVSKTGMPLKALAEYNIQQLSSILSRDLRFTAMQQKHAKQFHTFCDFYENLRPFTFRRKYAAVKNVHAKSPPDTVRPAASPETVEAFLEGMRKHPWYETMVRVAFRPNRIPSKGEWAVIDWVRKVVEAGEKFGVMKFVDLLYQLREGGYDMQDRGMVKLLHFLRKTLRVPDVALEGFIASCEKIPEWLLSLYHPKEEGTPT